MTESNKISVEDASKMSLDEYINASGICGELRKKRKSNNKQHGNNVQLMDLDVNMPPASSQQWRLYEPNRPIGMPPLIPSTARQRNYNRNNYRNNRRQQYQKPYADRDLPSNINGINRNNLPHNRHSSRQNSILHAALRKTLQGNTSFMPNSINSNGVTSALVPVMSNPNNAVATLNNLTQGVVGSVPNFLNLFNNILEKWDETRQLRSQPKYNLQVQNEISEIQGKPLYLTCTSEGTPSVISFDGPGDEDCIVKVTTTNTSLNQRFA